jgi:hypothetical protein
MGRWALWLIFKEGQHKTDDSEAQSDNPDEQMAHFTRANPYAGRRGGLGPPATLFVSWKEGSMSGCVMTVLDIEQQDALWHGGGEKLHGRVAFVTGGIRGIGAAICKSLGNQHATVAAGYGQNIDRANAFADEH